METIQQRGPNHNRRAMLIIMEHRNLHALTELLLDIKAFRRLDIFEIDTPEGGFQTGDDLDQFVRIIFADFQIEDIDIGELLEQHAFAFHHRLRRQRTDIAEAKHCRTVGNDAYQIGSRRQCCHLFRFRNDLFAGRRHTG